MIKRVGWLLPTVVLLLVVLLSLGCGGNSSPEQNGEAQDGSGSIILATTTSTYDTGLLDAIIPEFEEKTGFMVKPIAVGTGKALAMGENGDADVLLVHAPEAEMELVQKEVVVNRQKVMHNYFLVVGPSDDPAGISGMEGAVKAFSKIAEEQALFVSRGDDSGTHKKELGIWEKCGITPSGEWYIETGTGMGDTLKVASEKRSYTLTDWGTYLSLKENLSLVSCVTDEDELLNVYHVMQVNPEKYTGVNAEGAAAFVDFMVSPETQQAIGSFKKEELGDSLFVPDAVK